MKYRLKKDLPGLKAGTLFNTKGSAILFDDMGENISYFDYDFPRFIMNNSEWFEPVHDNIVHLVDLNRKKSKQRIVKVTEKMKEAFNEGREYQILKTMDYAHITMGDVRRSNEINEKYDLN